MANVMMWVWLGIVIICVVVELCTTALTTIWFAFSGVVMIFLSKFNIPLQWQILIFLVIAFALLFVSRPLVLKKIRTQKTNVNALEGQKVIVTQKITELEKGTVKLNGVTWNAKSSDPSVEIDADTLCEITEVTGSTLVVKKIESVTDTQKEGE